MKATERTIEGFFLIGNPFSNVTFANVSLTNLISKNGHLPLLSQFSSFGFSPLQMTVWRADETFEWFSFKGWPCTSIIPARFNNFNRPPYCKNFESLNELTTRTVVRVRRFPLEAAISDDHRCHRWSELPLMITRPFSRSVIRATRVNHLISAAATEVLECHLVQIWSATS